MKARLRHLPFLWLAVAGPLQAGDPGSATDLPALVKDALARNFAGAEVIAVERDDRRNDYVYYLVTLREGKTRKQVTLTETGEITPAR